MTYDQLENYVSEALEQHISRDEGLDDVDRKWEEQNFIDEITRMLRLHGYDIPERRAV